MVRGLRVYAGGLMRCCLESIYKHEEEGGSLDEGTVIGCRYHKDPNEPEAVVKDGAWHWVGIKPKDAGTDGSGS